MNKKVYLIVGSPGVGKSWALKQLKDKYHYIAHDDYKQLPNFRKVGRILNANTDKPIVTETPFSVSEFEGPLRKNGYDVEVMYMVDKPEIVSQRYKEREGKDIPKQHLTRQETYIQRAKDSNSFIGTPIEVLKKLKGD